MPLTFMSATIGSSASLMVSISGQAFWRNPGFHLPGEQSPEPSWKGLNCLVAHTSIGGPKPTQPEPSLGLTTLSSSSSEVSWSLSMACQWGSASSEALVVVRVSITCFQKSGSLAPPFAFLFFGGLTVGVSILIGAGSSVGRIIVSSITMVSMAGGAGNGVWSSARSAVSDPSPKAV